MAQGSGEWSQQNLLGKELGRKPAIAFCKGGAGREEGGAGAFHITNLTWETARDHLQLALGEKPSKWMMGESTGRRGR